MGGDYSRDISIQSSSNSHRSVVSLSIVTPVILMYCDRTEVWEGM